MLRSRECPKCSGRSVSRVPGDVPHNPAPNAVGLGLLRPAAAVMRVVCLACGYSEEWVESAEDRDRILERFGTL